MKIRITGKPLKKAQAGLDFPKISMPAPVFDANGQPRPEEAPKGYFDQKPPKEMSAYEKAMAAGIGPTFQMDEVDKEYQSNPGTQMQYDFSLNNYHKSNPNKDSRKYSKFMQEKYNLKDNPQKGNFSSLAGLITLGSGITDAFTDRKKQRDFNSYMREQQMSDNLFPKVSGSRGDYVTTGTSFGMFRPDQYVVNKGMYTSEYGGENPMNMNTMKIRIISGPEQMAYGGQSGYGLDMGSRSGSDNMNESQYDSVGNTLGPVPREMANIEAEKGETVYGDIDGDGALEHMNIGGKRHTQGGTPLNVPEGSFIFSDTKKMAIKDDEILKQFGLSARPSGYTPAEIARRYNINKYKAIMEDPDTDAISKQTAQLMVEKYNEKLALLSMVQESLKGFPQGKPQVAGEYEEGMQMEQMEEEENPEMQYGGYLPQAQFGIPGQLPMFNPATMYGNYSTPGYATAPGPGVRSATGRSAKTIVVQSSDGRKPAVTISEDDIFNPAVINDLKKRGYNINFSPRIAKGDTKVPIRQGKQSSGLYGDVQMSEITELKARHPWYFANKPNWNPANPADVLDFQTRYDTEFANQKGYSYFDGKKAYSQKDKKLGEYTYNAPGLDMSPKRQEPGRKFSCTPNGVVELNPNNPMVSMQAGVYNSYEEALAVCQESKPEKPKIPPNINSFTKNDPLPFGYMAPDIVNMFAAAAIPPKKYLPYMAPFKTMVPDPTFYDPNRELAANAEQANIQSQYLSNFAGPQSFMANTAAVQGRAAENAANILGRYNNLNVGVANDFSVRRSDIKNREMLANTERANELYRGNVIANEQYSNARRQYLNNIAKTYGTAFNNRMNLGMVNAVNPMFNVDPMTGRSYFKKGYDPSKLSGVSGGPGGDNYWGSVNAGFMAAKAQFPELTASEYLRNVTGRSTSTDSNGDGIMDSQRMSAQQMINNGAYRFSAYGGPVMFPF